MNHEKAVRDAAVTLHEAIVGAREAGLFVAWPSNPDGLRAIAVSETKKSAVTVGVTAPAEVSSETVNKATVAAQKAADRVVEKAKE